MLDDDDVDFFILAQPNGGGWLLGVICLIILVVMVVIVSGNKDECAKLHCEHGTPILAHHECLCVEKPTQPERP